MTYRMNRRDNNEPEILALFAALGAIWIPMSRDAGFDGLLCFHGRAHIVEIKNHATRWKLTQAEQERRAEVEAAGIAYNIVTNEDDAQALLES